MEAKNNYREYKKSEIISFCNTKAEFGGLSNMAADYPIFVNELNIPSVEALYQACRYPLFPEIQSLILGAKSPMEAKKISYDYISQTRQDWGIIRTKVMDWCLSVKLIQHWDTFGQLLAQTESRPIVEYSAKDDFWGAKDLGNGMLGGVNALGRLLMSLRQKYIIEKQSLGYVSPPKINGFLLYDMSINTVYDSAYYFSDLEEHAA
jgi:N-glycosidase YbiA